MILVTGAGGKTGKTLVKVLSKFERVCAFVHREGYISSLKSLGAEKVIVGDLRDETAVRNAMQGAHAIYHICPNMSPYEEKIGELAIREAHRADVKHFVYHSVLHPQTKKMNHHWQKMRVEEMLFESGLPFTIVQPAPYMQNWMAGWKRIVESSVISVPYSVLAKFSFVDLDDVAEAIKIVLTEDCHTYATYELAGTIPISHVEVAEILSHVLEREVKAKKEDLREWKKLHERELSAYALENLFGMFAYYDRWGLPGNPNVLRWLLGREPVTIESFMKRAVEQRDVIR